MNNSKFAKALHFFQWLIAAFGVIMALVCFSNGGVGIIGGIIILISACLISPIPNKFSIMSNKPMKKALVQVFGSFTLFIVGVLVTPTNSAESSKPAVDIEQTQTTLVTTTLPVAETTTTTLETTTTTAKPITTTTTTTTTPKPTTTTTTTTPKPTTTTTTTTPKPTTTTIQTQPLVRKYWINHDSMIVHSPDCNTIPDYKDDFWEYIENLDINWAIANGYRPCQRCNPIWHN